jgi:hypothetical protein
MSAFERHEDEVIQKLIKDGLSGTQIGAILGRSRNLIIGRSHRMGWGTLKPVNPAKSEPDKKTGQARLPRRPRLQKTGSRTEREYDASGRNLPLWELEPDQCKWPLNDPAPGKPHLFCGHQCVETEPDEKAKPYCPHHTKRARMEYFRPTDRIAATRG